MTRNTPVILLPESVKAWHTPDFNTALKAEVEQLDAGQLPLQQGLSHSSIACDDNINVVIMQVSETDDTILAKLGVFYTGIISGCSCADDPTPVEEQAEYCEVQLEIDTPSSSTIITLVTDT